MLRKGNVVNVDVNPFRSPDFPLPSIAQCWQGWALFSKCCAAHFALQILKSAALRASVLQACLRCSALALQRCASAKKHERCSGSSKIQALQRHKSVLQKLIEQLEILFFKRNLTRKTRNFLVLSLPLQHCSGALQHTVVGPKMTALQRCGAFQNPALQRCSALQRTAQRVPIPECWWGCSPLRGHGVQPGMQTEGYKHQLIHTGKQPSSYP